MKTPDKVKKVCAFEKDPGKGSISSLWSVVLLVICVSLYCISVLKFNSLPRPNSGRFSGTNAKEYLRNLANLGPRIGGSRANEVETVAMLVDWLTEIQSWAGNFGYTIDVDVQIADGNLQIDFTSSAVSAVYYGVKNVVARLRPNGQTIPENALLVNAHFDSVPTSEGGGDDGSMCAVMLETLQQLVMIPYSADVEHSVIFLFNGFEENALQGSHAFITKHPWAQSVRAVLNLEAAGNGGREMVFQAGPKHPWLMNHYRKSVPRPYASTMAEEMFQAGMIPSDTDFRVFRDYGKIPGMDFAYAYNGYVYHTEFDTEKIFPAESLQHAGDNVLPLIESLVRSEELKDTKSHEDGHVVYYDFFNVALIYYSETTGAIINAILATIGVLLLAISCFFFVRQGQISVLVFARELGFTMIIQMLSLAVGAGLVLLAAVIYHAAGRSMAWFTSSYLLFFLYFCPFFLGLAIGPACFVGFRKGNPLSIPQNAQLFLHIQHLFYIVVLSAFTGMGIRSSFLIMIPVFFYDISLLCNVALKLQAKPHAWMFVHLACQIIPFMWFSTNIVAQFTAFIPMQGRGGSSGNPELLMAGFCILSAALLGSLLIPLITVCRSPRITALLFAVLWIVGIILMATPLGFAYREGKTPQRFSIYHMNRQFHSLSGSVRYSDAGFFVIPTDSHGRSVIKDSFGESLNITERCNEEFLCGFPFGVGSSFWYPAARSVIPDTEVVLTVSQREVQDDAVILHFTLQGPDRMQLLISPQIGLTLAEWSFEEAVPDHFSRAWQGRGVYFITYTNFRLGVPQPRDTTEFWLKFNGNPQTTEKIVDIAVSGEYIWYHEQKSSEFRQKISEFPSWSTVHSWIISYDLYEF
ncbi:endoplasmic reticulum metallopeptidase 1-like [Phlebotomus argentipes]|uniref:endoplasmic reticulum metallopeptidase 1-like n=1 Tax=Phlebotomus argentipes TaxID=94469 RepID=UPI0028936B1D|nr:endoplasmic reticulum metallopeptidase 1-like [Phlebotomus argentipes]